MLVLLHNNMPTDIGFKVVIFYESEKRKKKKLKR